MSKFITTTTIIIISSFSAYTSNFESDRPIKFLHHTFATFV
jgi:hypothetical protein